MMRFYKALVFSLFLLFGATACAEQGVSNPATKSNNCELDNQALRAMGKGVLTIDKADGTRLQLEIKIADNGTTRAAGFQKVCAETMRKTPILFLFYRELKPRFHMNNVVAPIDIAFIRKDGSIDSIQAMQTYSLVELSKPLYGPSSMITAALEGHSGFFAENKISLADRISWDIATE